MEQNTSGFSLKSRASVYFMITRKQFNVQNLVALGNLAPVLIGLAQLVLCRNHVFPLLGGDLFILAQG